jgi:hypothetical protein
VHAESRVNHVCCAGHEVLDTLGPAAREGFIGKLRGLLRRASLDTARSFVLVCTYIVPQTASWQYANNLFHDPLFLEVGRGPPTHAPGGVGHAYQRMGHRHVWRPSRAGAPRGPRRG